MYSVRNTHGHHIWIFCESNWVHEGIINYVCHFLPLCSHKIMHHKPLILGQHKYNCTLGTRDDFVGVIMYHLNPD